MIIDSRQIIIKPLTPVFVWSGETLFSDLDFIIDGNDILIIDLDKVIREIKNVGKLDQYKELLRELLEKYKQTGRYMELLRELYGVRLEFKNAITGGKRIDQILNINPYIIPASEVKGLIRTAVINMLLRSDNKVFNKIMKNILDEMNKSNLKNIGQIVEKVVKVKLPTNTEYDALKTLLISDPIVESTKFGLSEIEILSLNGQPLASIYAITFTEGKLIYDAKIIKPTNYGVYKDYNIEPQDGKITWNNIVKWLKDFSKVIILNEKSKINKFLSNINKFPLDKQNLYKEELNKYLKLIECIEKMDDCIPLRIGMFTGYAVKTIEVREDVKKKREKILSNYYSKKSRGKIKTWDDSTLKITGGVGLGWVKVCIK